MMRKMLSLRNVALFGVVAAGLGLWAATRTWVLVDVQATTVQVPQIVVDGSQAAPAVTALCVVVLAAALALLIGHDLVQRLYGDPIRLLQRQKAPVRWLVRYAVCLAVLLTALTLPEGVAVEFIYFQF